MKFRGFIIVIIFFMSFFQLNTPTPYYHANTETGCMDITVSEAYNLIENTSNFFILDVRTEGEYIAGHINNSYLTPYDEISSNQNKLPRNKSHPILVYCRSGTRSSIACSTLVELNYSYIYNIQGGFTEWVQANYPYESSSINSTTDVIIILVIAIFTSILLVISLIIVTRMIFIKLQRKEELRND